MGKISRSSINAVRFLCLAFIVWFCLYFFFGERFSIEFTDRIFASWFPQILVFLAAASIYGLFILAIRSYRKKWINILLFLAGFIFALLPFLAYHGYFQYQCGIWNREIMHEKILYINKLNKDEFVKIIHSKCEKSREERSDTIISKQITRFLELNNPVKIQKAEKADWTVAK